MVKDSAVSGQDIPEFYIGLADGDGQIVGTENSKKIEIRFKSVISTGTDALKYEPVISGTTIFYSVSGVYELSNI